MTVNLYSHKRQSEYYEKAIIAESWFVYLDQLESEHISEILKFIRLNSSDIAAEKQELMCNAVQEHVDYLINSKNQTTS